MFILIKTTLLVFTCTLVLSACGGGSSGEVTPTTTPTTATLKLSIDNLPAGAKVGALQVHFNLPAGVIPASLAGNDASASIASSGNATGLGGVNLASYVSSLITIGTINSGGLVSGEYLTVNCTITPGTVVSAASFPVLAIIESADDPGATISKIPVATDPNDDRSINLTGVALATGKIYTILIAGDSFSHTVVNGETIAQVVSDLALQINNHVNYTATVDVTKNALIHVLTGARTATISVTLDSTISGLTVPIAVTLQ